MTSPDSQGVLGGLRVAVLGLGEAGGAIANDLAAAGATVRGFDPADVDTPAGVERATDPAAAVDGVTLVMAITAAKDAPAALAQTIDRIPTAAVYADLATAAASTKRELAASAAAKGVAFADVALMSTVPGKGLLTPALASGLGSERYAELLAPASVPVEVIGQEPGLAATRKLLRSVAIKGLAAVVIESRRAAEAAGLEAENWANLVDQFTAMDGAFLDRLVTGTDQHALRRFHEMEAATSLLEDLGVDPLMTRATVESLRRVTLGTRHRP